MENLESDPRMCGVRAVGGIAVTFSGEDASSTADLLGRLGFVTMPVRDPTPGRWRRFWNDVHAALMIWTFNPGTLEHRRLTGMGRVEFWMTTEAFLDRHGSHSAGRARQSPGASARVGAPRSAARRGARPW